MIIEEDAKVEKIGKIRMRKWLQNKLLKEKKKIQLNIPSGCLPSNPIPKNNNMQSI